VVLVKAWPTLHPGDKGSLMLILKDHAFLRPLTFLWQTEQSPEGVEILLRELEIRAIPPNERTYW
jgi:hypothetical protein